MSGIDLKKIKRVDRSVIHHEHVPQWGGMVHLRLLSAMERIELSLLQNSGEFLVEVLCRCICTEDGKPAPDVVQAIRDADSEHTQTISDLAYLAAKMNGLLKAAKEDAKKKSE